MSEDIIRQIIQYAVDKARAVTDDEEAFYLRVLYKEFDKQIGRQLEVGEYIQYKEELYKVLQAHTVQEQWTPDVSPSIFAKVIVGLNNEILDWVQPDSTNAYMNGDKVRFNGKIYVSVIDNNIWAPSAYPQGWKEI